LELPEQLVYPASYFQRQIYRASGGSSSRDSMVVAWRLRGPWDLVGVWSALNHLLKRHDALRTTLRRSGDEVFQVVSSARDLTVERLRDGADRDQRNGSLDTSLLHESERPFDLRNDVLVRGGYARLDGNDHVLALVINHAVFDGASADILRNELLASYEHRVLRRAPPLRPVDLQFADYAAWEAHARSATAVEYWRSQLRHPAPYLSLGHAERRATASGYRGVPHTIPALDRDLIDRLILLGRAQAASPAMAITAAVAGVLAPFAEDEIAIGLIHANRDQPQLGAIVGCVMDVIPLRLRLTHARSFGDLLAEVRDSVLAAYCNRIPLAALRRDSHVDASYDTIVNVIPAPSGSCLELDSGDTLELDVHDVALEGRDFPGRFPWAGAAINYIVAYSPGRALTGSVESDAHRFSPRERAALGEVFRKFTARVTEDPAAPVAQLAHDLWSSA
jgi:hypothetical protein